MIVELFLLFTIWGTLAKLISALLGIPTVLSFPIVIALLVLYDILIPKERNNKTQEINIGNFSHMLRNSFFMLLLILFDIGLYTFTFRLEASGAKIIFPDSKWLPELLAFFEVLGIRDFVESFKISANWGLISSLLIILGFYFTAYFAWQIYGTLQKIKAERKGIRENITLLIQPLICFILASILTSLIYFAYMAKVAQLQVAKMIWKDDFQMVYQNNDSIIGVQTTYPDLNQVLSKHEGENRKIFVTRFPWIFFGMHFFTAFFTEIFFLHILMNLGEIERRHGEIIHLLRIKLETSFRKVFSTLRRAYPQQEQEELQQLQQQEQQQQQISQHQIQQEQQERIITEPIDRRNGDGEILETTNTQVEETVNPEDRLQRVIGGSETITPREARMYPELYIVENRNGNYLIYTREFYERITNNGRC
jgi:hypothetical protein